MFSEKNQLFFWKSGKKWKAPEGQTVKKKGIERAKLGMKNAGWLEILLYNIKYKEINIFPKYKD